MASKSKPVHDSAGIRSSGTTMTGRITITDEVEALRREFAVLLSDSAKSDNADQRRAFVKRLLGNTSGQRLLKEALDSQNPAGRRNKKWSSSTQLMAPTGSTQVQ